MTYLKQTMKLLMLCLLVATTSCQEKYPDLEDGLYAEFVTNKGTMVAKLYYDKTPVTVANFVSLAEGSSTMVDKEFKNKKFYNGIIFEGVIEGFMIQGDDAAGSGSGGLGSKFTNEFKP